MVNIRSPTVHGEWDMVHRIWCIINLINKKVEVQKYGI